MKFDKNLSTIMTKAEEYAINQNHAYVTPEHVLREFYNDNKIKTILEHCGANIKLIQNSIENYLLMLPVIDGNKEFIPSNDLADIYEDMIRHAASAQQEYITIYDMLISMVKSSSFCSEVLIAAGVEALTLMKLQSSNDTQNNTTSEGLTTDIIEKYTTNLNKLAEENKLAPLIGRINEVNRSIHILNRKNKNNVIYVGEPGVGKTTVAEGIAQMITKDQVPDSLRGNTIYSLDVAGMIAGTKYRGEFEERVKNVLDAINKLENSIVYIDEIHTIIGAGATGGGSMDMANILKPFLTNSNIKFIGSTTYDEYKKFIEKDKALLRRFQKIEIVEPTPEETVNIINNILSSYEDFHGVKYSSESVQAAVDLSVKYLYDKFLPDKAIDIIDEVGAFVKLNSTEKVVNVEDIEKTIATMARIPEKKVTSDDRDKLKNLDSDLKQEIFGQDEAIETVVKQIKLSKSPLNDDSTKPIANLAFIGPTGVGKTELCKQLSNIFNIPLVRFDMSEYQMEHSADKFIGTPPGYVGFEQGGLLTEAIKKNPYCILLLDEIEKAHKNIYNTLLQIMDYATITDNTGKKIDFKNVILIMTSNVGAAKVGRSLIGFGEKKTDNSSITEEYKKVFSPEFRNRIDKVVIFNNLSKDNLGNILDKELAKLQEKLSINNITMKLTDTCRNWILEKGLSPEFGAREIKRIVQQQIKPEFVDKVLFGNNKKLIVTIDVVDNQLKFIDKKIRQKQIELELV